MSVLYEIAYTNATNVGWEYVIAYTTSQAIQYATKESESLGCTFEVCECLTTIQPINVKDIRNIILPDTLAEIVQKEDIKALEHFSNKQGKYSKVIQVAKNQNVNLDHLEELLGMI